MSMSMSMMMNAYVPPIPTGNMWTIDNWSPQLLVTDTAGTLITGYGFIGFVGDYIDISFDGANMWVTRSNNTIVKITLAGSVTTFSGLPFVPTQLAFDGANMWSTNNDSSVSKWSASGVPTTYSMPGVGPVYIAFDGTNMWTSNTNNTVTKISPAGATTSWATPAYGPIAFDGTNMWTVSISNISKISSSGSVTSYTGLGWVPNSIAFDGTNMWATSTLYVGNPSFTFYDYIYKISPSGTLTTYASPYTNISGIAFDGIYMWISGSTGQNANKGLFTIDLNGNPISIDTYGTSRSMGDKAFVGCLLSHWWGGS